MPYPVKSRVKLSEFRKGTGRLSARPDIQERYKAAVAALTSLGKLKTNQLRERIMNPSLGYNIPTAKAYHLTPIENLVSILRQGLLPRANQNPTNFSQADWLASRVPERVQKKLPSVFVELAEGKPLGQNLPTSLSGQRLGGVAFPVEEAIKRLSREDAFKVLAEIIAREHKYPLRSNAISRKIVRSRTGIDPQRGATAVRSGRGPLQVPEWVLEEGVPAALLELM